MNKQCREEQGNEEIIFEEKKELTKETGMEEKRKVLGRTDLFFFRFTVISVLDTTSRK
jgi:hypothetical protein